MYCCVVQFCFKCLLWGISWSISLLILVLFGGSQYPLFLGNTVTIYYTGETIIFLVIIGKTGFLYQLLRQTLWTVWSSPYFAYSFSCLIFSPNSILPTTKTNLFCLTVKNRDTWPFTSYFVGEEVQCHQISPSICPSWILTSSVSFGTSRTMMDALIMLSCSKSVDSSQV